MTEALVALSGGVDSSVALLRSLEFYDSVRACHIDNGSGASPEALAVASSLGVELLVLDAVDSFGREVLEASREMLRSGLTPNPCAMCNARVKLRIPFEILRENEILVTGHYTIRTDEGEFHRGLDTTRDQSYFLSMVPEGVLQRCRFPLGESLKEDVRLEATAAGLPFRTRESMDLCFDLWGDTSAGKQGVIIDTERGRTGEHSGIGGFTVGQRKGIGAHGEKRYVLSLEPESGIIFIGPEKNLYSEGCTLDRINWLAPRPAKDFRASIQTRYRRSPVEAAVELEPDTARVRFHAPEKAVAPGQVGALYHGNRLLGGGVITHTDAHEER